MDTQVSQLITPEIKTKKINLSVFFKNTGRNIFYAFMVILISYGWLNRSNSNLSPESGIGYYLGIVGGTLMLLLLLYPLRKKARFMCTLGLVKHWFKMHMLFGVLGPVAILYHANFGLGSINSKIAMFSMLSVAMSGLIGRYLYAKIHHGLYGRKANIKELKEELMLSKGQLGLDFTLSKRAVIQIKIIERQTLKKRNILLATLLWPVINLKTQWTKYQLRKIFNQDFSKSVSADKKDKKIIDALSNQASAKVNAYLDALYKIFGFKIFQSLFSLWHVLHLPLFVMLIITGILHVFVVHSY